MNRLKFILEISTTRLSGKAKKKSLDLTGMQNPKGMEQVAENNT